MFKPAWNNNTTASGADNLQRRRTRAVARSGHDRESLLDLLPFGICLLDPGGQVLYVNRTLASWNPGPGCPEATVHGMLHPGCRQRRCRLQTGWEDMWRKLLAGVPAEYGCHDDVTGRELHLQLQRYSHPQHRKVAGRRAFALLLVEDIGRRTRTDRVLADSAGGQVRRHEERPAPAGSRIVEETFQHAPDWQALTDAEKKYTCLMEFPLTGFYIARGTRIIECNRSFADIFDYSREELCGMDLGQLFPDCAAAGADVRAGRPASLKEAVRGRTRDGHDIWLYRSQACVDRIGEVVLTLGNVVDMTAEKNAQDAMECLLCDKKILSERLLQAQESERKQIAAELHDSIGQGISAVKFGLENTLRDHRGQLPASVGRALEAAVGKLCDTVDELRRVSMDLRPSILDDLGLLATIGWFCREFRALFPQLDIEVRTGIPERDIPDALKLVMFRILQEALNNIGKHAHAGKVTVELACRENTLVFSIADDGRGFAVNSPVSRRGFGLSSMRERAKLSRGDLSVDSAPGGGTYIEACWPVEQ